MYAYLCFLKNSFLLGLPESFPKAHQKARRLDSFNLVKVVENIICNVCFLAITILLVFFRWKNFDQEPGKITSFHKQKVLRNFYSTFFVTEFLTRLNGLCSGGP